MASTFSNTNSSDFSSLWRACAGNAEMTPRRRINDITRDVICFLLSLQSCLDPAVFEPDDPPAGRSFGLAATHPKLSVPIAPSFYPPSEGFCLYVFVYFFL